MWGMAKTAAPGLFDLISGGVTSRMGQNEAANRLRTAQGPLYGQSMDAAQAALGQAGSMDPNAFAKQRFDAQQGMLAGKDAADMQSLQRILQAQGQGGLAAFNPGVDGINPNGQAMNPQMAAFLAAKNARDSKMSADSLDAGQAQIDRLVNRSGMLQKNAAATQGAGITAQGTQPSKSAAMLKMLGGAGDIMKKSGMFGTGMDWLKKTIGNSGWGNFDFSAGDSSFFGE